MFMPKHRTVIIILTCLLIAVIFGWFYQHRQSSMALDSFQNKITVDYQRKFIDLTRHYSMLVDLTETYEETGSDQEELFEIALNNKLKSLELAVSNLTRAASRVENTPLSEILQKYYLYQFERDLKTSLLDEGNVNEVGQILKSDLEELKELVFLDHEDFMKNENQLRVKEILEGMRSEIQQTEPGEPAETEKLPTAEIDTVNEAIEILEAVDEVILSQSYEPVKSLELNNEQIDTLAEEMQALKKVSMPNPHGSGYPGYEITLNEGNEVPLTIEIQDPVYARISGRHQYFEGTETIWDMAKEWLPVKKTEPGTVEHLYKANKVEIKFKDAGYIIEYDQGKNPDISFRLATLVRILDSAEAVEKSKLEDAGLQIKLTFYFDDHKETVKVYGDYALYEDKVLKKEDIGQTLESSIRAG